MVDICNRKMLWAATFGLLLIFWMRMGPATKRKNLGVTNSTISSAVMPRGMLLLSEPGQTQSVQKMHSALSEAWAERRNHWDCGHAITQRPANSQRPRERRRVALVLLLRLKHRFIHVGACWRR